MEKEVESSRSTSDRPTGSPSLKSLADPFQVPWSRQASPVSPTLVSSFQLADGQPWGDPTFIIPVEEESTSSGMNYVQIMLLVLSWGGWIRIIKPGNQKRFGLVKFIPFIVSISMNIFVVISTLCSAWNGENQVVSALMPRTVSIYDRTMSVLDAAMRHILIFMSHFGMYVACGSDLTIALGKKEFAPEAKLVMLLAIVAALELMLDAGDVSLQLFSSKEFNFNALMRRLCILLSRLPATACVMAMTAMPKRLCQDLERIESCLATGNVAEAHHLYSVFWKRLRVARKWYNATVTPHFLIAIFRLPLVLYCVIYRKERESGKGYGWTVFQYLLTYAALDVFQMFMWISPAIAIRPLHRNALDACVAQAGLKPSENTDRARELATMMAQLHHLVGMRFLGFIVTWRLVTYISTVVSIVLSMLKATQKRNPGSHFSDPVQ